MPKQRVSVTRESNSGRNLNFLDRRTGREMTRAEFANEIEGGNYPDYHVRRINGLRTPVSNPDSLTDNNLD